MGWDFELYSYININYESLEKPDYNISADTAEYLKLDR